MTDTLESTNSEAAVEIPPMIQIMKAQYDTYVAKVAEIDEQTGADSGLTKQAVDAIGETRVAEITAAIHSLLTSTDPFELLGVSTVIRRALKASDGTVKTYVEANKPAQVELPAELIESLRVARKAAVDAANLMRNVVSTTNAGWAETNLDAFMPALTNKRGVSGGRESFKRLKGAFLWTVDGTPVDGNKMKDLVAELGGVSSTDIKKQLAAQKGEEFDFADPPANFSFTVTHGDVDDPNHVTYNVTAHLSVSDPEDSNDEDDSYEDEDVETTDVEEDPFS